MQVIGMNQWSGKRITGIKTNKDGLRIPPRVLRSQKRAVSLSGEGDP